MINTILQGDCLSVLKTLPDEHVQTVVTSPPYYGLRDYGIEGQIGLEETPQQYIKKLVEVFREVRRVLRHDGTCWLNLGDSYAGSGKGGQSEEKRSVNWQPTYTHKGIVPGGMKPKDLMMIPARVAIALQDDGWYLRSDIIWHKPNVMPESCKDRPTSAHEHVFLLAKSERYYYDSEAIKEPAVKGDAHAGNRNYRPYAVGGRLQVGQSEQERASGRNKRNVWTIASQPFSGAALLADYVGVDGKPYKVSEDCPVHGQKHGTHTQKTDGYDAQRDHVLSHMSDTSNHPDQGQSGESSATLFRENQGCENATAHARKSENILAHKTDVPSDMNALQIDHGIEDIQGKSVYSSGSQFQLCSEPAIDHSKQNHKTDLVPETSSAYTPSEQSSSHTGDMSRLSLWSEEYLHMHESSIQGRGGQDVAALVQSPDRNSNIFSYTHGITAKCTCQIVSIDHFATMPPKLVEPCILAGSRTGDIVLDPFMGAGTVAMVAIQHGRSYLGIELNPAYITLANKRIANVQQNLWSMSDTEETHDEIA